MISRLDFSNAISSLVVQNDYSGATNYTNFINFCVDLARDFNSCIYQRMEKKKIVR